MLVNSSVTTAAADTQLALLATVKTELGVSGTSQDVKLTRLLRVVGGMFMEELGREPWEQTYSDKVPGAGGTRLYLPHWPIRGNPSSVTYGTGSSPTTVTASTYTVGSSSAHRRDFLERVTKWALSEETARTQETGSRPMDYTIAYTAGWVLPTQITAWVTGQVVTSGQWYSASDTVGSSNVTDPLLIFRAGGAGTTDSAEPTWPTAEAGTVVDNDITWTAHRTRLPLDLEEAAMLQVMDYFRGGLSVPSNLSEVAFQGERLKFRDNGHALSPAVKAICRRYR